MYYQLEITETARNSLKDEAIIFNIETKNFSSTEDIKQYLIDRYGRLPGGRNKIYRDNKAREAVEVGFCHSFWEKDISHNSKAWFQTDWIEISEVITKPVLLKEAI